MSIVKLLNKKTGTVYVYESVNYWDPEKKKPTSKRKLIGKIDPETGEMIPTGPRGRKPREQDTANPSAEGSSDLHSKQREQESLRILELNQEIARQNARIVELNHQIAKLNEEIVSLHQVIRQVRDVVENYS